MPVGWGGFQPRICSWQISSLLGQWSSCLLPAVSCSRDCIAFWILSPWIPGVHLVKVRSKVKGKWWNFLSGQNAITSSRATELLGRRSWFACAYNCIRKWLSPSHSGLKGWCWLSLVFVWHSVVFTFSQFMMLLIPNKISLKSIWSEFEHFTVFIQSPRRLRPTKVNWLAQSHKAPRAVCL